MKFFKQKESDTRHIGASGREKEQQKEQEFGPFFSQEISKSYLVIEPRIKSGKMLIPVDCEDTNIYCNTQINHNENYTKRYTQKYCK